MNPKPSLINKSDETKRLFNAIYEKEADAIFRFCLIRVSDREQALDLVSETFVRLWQTLSGGKKPEKVRAFIFTIAHNLIIDWYRKKKPISLEGLASGEGEPYEPNEEGAAISAEMETEARFLMDSVRKVSSSYRQPVYLRYVEGLSPPEIGEIMGISANAASVRINRGLEELREITGYAIDSEEK